MKRVFWIGEACGYVTAGFGNMKMGVEYDLCSATNQPAHGFRISPALVTDHDSECQRANLKNLPAGTGQVCQFFGGIELDFVLEPGDRTVLLDDQSSS